MSIILFVLIFGIIVIAHEFGHFIVAKMNGIHVVEFSIGMGPTLIAFNKGDTKYSLKLLPIGGACMFEGEDGLNIQEGEESSGSFNKANVWARIATVFAGPFFNFILAVIVSMIMVSLMRIDLPVVSVLENSAAMDAGLQDGDKLISLNGEKIYLYDELILFNRVNGGNTATVVFDRDGEIMETELTPRYDEAEGRYLIGVQCAEAAQEEGFARLKYAWYEIRFTVQQTYKSLLLLVKGQIKSEEVAGPVGIANAVGDVYDATKEYGGVTVFINMLNITLLLTVNLGILNLLPIPALDGGRLVFLLIEVIRGKPIPPEKEGMVHLAGLIFFMGLMVFILFNDIKNIFG